MNNSVAFFFGLCILGLLVVDWRVNDAEFIILWGRELVRLIDWLAFWR